MGVCLTFSLFSAIHLEPGFRDTAASNSWASLGFVAGTGKLLIGFSTAGSSHFGPLSSVSASLHFPFPKTIFTPLPPFLFIYLKKTSCTVLSVDCSRE